MAAKYRKIDPRIWDDEVFDSLTAADAFAVLWLETCRGVNRAGVAVVGLGEAADKLRLQGVDQAWDTLSRVCPGFRWPLQKVGRNTVVVILRTWFRYNEPTNADHLKGMLSDLIDVPRCELLNTYAETVKPYLLEKWHGDFDRVFPDLSTPCTTPCPHQKRELELERELEREQKREQERKKDIVPNGTARKTKPVPAAYSADFLEFWSAFPDGRKKSKGDAWKSWQAAIKLADVETIVAKAGEYAISAEGRSDYVKMPSTWLNQRCWEDDPVAWAAKDRATSDPRGNLALLERRIRDREAKTD